MSITSYPQTPKDISLEIARGNIPGISHINKFGRNPDVDTGTDPEDIWDGGLLWVPPTLPRLHNLASTSATDAGTLVITGTATGGTDTTIIDTAADFVTAGVAIGDAIINDTTHGHSIVTAVAITTLTIHKVRHGGNFASGHVYRVASPASTGAFAVHIFGLDANMLEQEEFIILNGIIAVPTVNTYYRINRMQVEGALNRTVSNTGIISATAAVDLTVTSQINAGNGQTLQTIYTVPRNKSAFITQIYAGINRGGAPAGAMADIALRQTPFASTDGAGSRVEHFFNVSIAGSSHVMHTFKPYKHFPPETDLWLRVEQVSDNNTDISGGFDIILVDT